MLPVSAAVFCYLLPFVISTYVTRRCIALCTLRATDKNKALM